MEADRPSRELKRPKRLADEITRLLVADIETGKSKAGDKLPSEQQLSREFGVSRTVVREAISQLNREGLVESRQGLGAFVTSIRERTVFRISPTCHARRKELAKILELRTSVESDAAALAAQNRTQEQLGAIRGHLERMAAALGAGDDGMEDRVEAEAAFYRAVAAASANSYFIEFIGLLENRVMSGLKSVAIKNARAVEWSREVYKEHEAIFRAIERQQAERARSLARAHFTKAAKRLAARADYIDRV